jgi:hypothetical protein
MRVVDFMIALPSIFVLILLATIYGTNPVTLVIVIGGLRWMGTARQVRGAFLSLREREFVEAARCLGASPARIILRHLHETVDLATCQVVERWTGVYPVGGPSDALVVAPDDRVRVVVVTSGTGASTAFGLAEDVFGGWR